MFALLQLLFVPAVLFMVIVAPLWLIFHYVTLWRTQKHAGHADKGALNGMWHAAQRLEGRVMALEKLLDAEVPGWRSKPL
jgi:phage shock protein B